MTVSSSAARADYVGNGVTDTHAVPFRFLANADLQVLRTVTATGVSTPLILDSLGADGYSVTGAGQPSGGEITEITPPPTGTTLTILRAVSRTQLTDYIPNDPFPAESHERAIDKLTMIVQEQDEKQERSFTLSPSLDPAGFDLNLPAPVMPGAAFGWNLTGNGLRYVDTYGPADLLLRTDLNDPLGGAGLVKFQQSGAGAVSRSLRAKNLDLLNLMDFTAEADRANILAGTTDIGPALAAAATEALARGRAGVKLPAGILRISAKQTINVTGLKGLALVGEGMGITQLVNYDASGNMLEITTQDGDWWLNSTQGCPIILRDLSIAATGANVGTGVRINGGTVIGRPRSPVVLDRIEIRGFSNPNTHAFLIGLHLNDCGQVYATNCRFLVGGPANLVPNAVNLTCTNNTMQATSIMFTGCEWYYGDTMVKAGDYVEGLHFTNNVMVGANLGLDWQPAAGVEAGLFWVGGHTSCVKAMKLTNLIDVNISGAHFQVTNGLDMTTCTDVVVTGCIFYSSAGTGYGIGLASAPNGIRGCVIANNQFSNFTTGISIGSTSYNVTVGLNNYNSVTTRVTYAGPTTQNVYVVPRVYSVSVVPTLTGGATSENFNVAIPAGFFAAAPYSVNVSANPSGSNDFIVSPDFGSATATQVTCRVVKRDGTNLPAGAQRFYLTAYGV